MLSSTRARTLALPLLVVAVMCVVKLEATQSIPLPSLSTPIASSMVDDDFLVVQDDGTVTFTDGSSTFSVVVPTVMRGSAYYMYSLTSSYGEMAVANASGIFRVRCGRSNKQCFTTTTVQALPVSPYTSRVLTIRNFEDNDRDLVMMATRDTVITYDVGAMCPVSNMTWAFENAYALDQVTGMRFSAGYLFVSIKNSQQSNKPGVIVKLSCSYNAQLHHSAPVITYLKIGASNFVVSSGYPDARYWTQTNTDLNRGYVNSFVHTPGFSSNGPSRPTVKPGEVIAPLFMGEYPPTQVGVIAVGNPSTLGFDLVCLYYAYTMGEGYAELTITDQYRASKTIGMPTLAFQTNENSATLTGVSRIANGWAIVNIGFGSCPMLQRKRDDQATVTSSLTSTQRKTREATDALANCTPSDCSVDSLGSCPAQQCWGDETTGGFLCCKHPPA